MDLFIFALLITTILIILSRSFFYYLNEISFKDKTIKKFILSLSLSFIFLFCSISGINILLHAIGKTIVYSPLLIPLTIFLIFYKFHDIKCFSIKIFEKINQQSRNIFKNLDPIKIFLLIVIFVQIICLSIRFLLPITHGDALTQYFYESLQISRLEDLSISNFYQIGEFFRTDSFGSFFDALIIQISDNWILSRSIRALALILIIFSSIEMANNIGSLSFKKSILLTSIILTLPDVWDISLSGKHDIYVFIFELTSFYLICLSIISKKITSKISFSLLSILISFMSVNLRLSSLTILLVSISTYIYHFFNFPRDLSLLETKKFFTAIPINIKFLVILIIFSSLIIPFFNYQYFSNPLYWLSPPGPLKQIFPNTISRLSYESISDQLTLRNIPLIIKPIGTLIYSSLAFEPIRFGLNKFKELNNLFFTLSEYFNYIGPKGMMVSILSFSPLTLFPYFSSINLRSHKKNEILVLLTFWILLWSLSIPYTRIALASSTSLIIFALSEPLKINNIFSNLKFFKLFRVLIMSYGILCIFIFSLWSISYISDLPIEGLLTKQNYSRTFLSREYLKLQNKVLNKKDVVPNEEFEKSWEKIERTNSDKYLLLKNTPSVFGYFINKGLIIYNSKYIPKEISKKSICYELDAEQNIKKTQC